MLNITYITGVLYENAIKFLYNCYSKFEWNLAHEEFCKQMKSYCDTILESYTFNCGLGTDSMILKWVIKDKEDVNYEYSFEIKYSDLLKLKNLK